MKKCKHCGKLIKLNAVSLWVDESLVFPQYCPSDTESDQKHEPEKETKSNG